MSKLKLNIFLAISVFLLAFASCSQQDGPNVPEETGTPMRFRARTDSESRAVTTNENIREKPFVVWGSFVHTGETSPVTNVFNATPVSFNSTTNSWEYDDTQYWLPGFTYNFAAIHPAEDKNLTADFSDGGFSFDYSISSSNRVDLLGAHASRACTGDAMSTQAVAFNFHHLLAQIHFVLKVDPVVTDNVIVTEAKVYGINTTATYSRHPTSDDYGWRTAGNITTKESPYAVSNGVEVAPGKSAHLFPDVNNTPLLVIPQQVNINARLELSYKIGESGTVKTVTSDISQAAAHHNGRWQIGRNHTYSLTIGTDDYIIFDVPTVSGWSLQEGGNHIIQAK